MSAQKMELWTPFGDKQYKITEKGAEWLGDLGIDLKPGFMRNGFARACLDWTERRHHVAGLLGRLLLTRFLELKWAARVNDSRGIRFTHKGYVELDKRLELHLPRP
jgi:hypothetical protein